MAIEIQMPKLGLTMEEGTVVRWLKKEGDKVNAGEILAEITTDKISHELEAPGDGILAKIIVGEGKTVPCQALLAALTSPGEKYEVSEDTAPEEKAAVSQAATSGPVECKTVASPVAGGSRIKISPIAKALAKKGNIDISLVNATGPEGRIVLKDIEAYLASGQSKVKASPVASKMAEEYSVQLEPSESRIMKKDIEQLMNAKSAALLAERIPLRGIRKVIAERMSQSWNIAPHVTINMEADMTEAMSLREKINQPKSGLKVSYTDILTKLVAHALTSFPTVNASLINGEIVKHSEINLGIAVALDDALIVPVIKNVASLGIGEISAQIKDMAERARTNKLMPDEISGGTFTITNLGMYGVDSFTPIINQPESAILGVNRIVEKPVVVKGAVVVRPMMNLSLSFDHRLIDGALAARFLGKVKELLENPALLFV